MLLVVFSFFYYTLNVLTEHCAITTFNITTKLQSRVDPRLELVHTCHSTTFHDK